MKKILFASSVKEAVKLLKSENAAFIGGGTEINRLNSLCKADPLVSLKFDKQPIARKGNQVILPLGTTFQDVVDSPDAPGYLKTAALFMASRQRREMATIAGNVAVNSCCSFMVPVLRACSAVLTINGSKDMDIEKYLSENEDRSRNDRIITSISVPCECKVAQKRIPSTTEQSHAVLTAAVTPKFAYVGVFGYSQFVLPMDTVRCEKCVARVLGENNIGEFKSDIAGSAEYKRYLTCVVVADLLKEVR